LDASEQTQPCYCIAYFHAPFSMMNEETVIIFLVQNLMLGWLRISCWRSSEWNGMKMSIGSSPQKQFIRAVFGS
jgi:hypothetical protein